MGIRIVRGVLLFALLIPVVAVLQLLPEVNGTFDHGGGCRKSSPKGQCCHMDRKKGVVHCH